jgi:site-specific recombinase XerD
MVQTIVKSCIKQAGLTNKKYTTHSCRHTTATLLYQNGTDINTLKEILGHKHISSTTIYTAVHSQQKKDAMNSNPLADIKRKS